MEKEASPARWGQCSPRAGTPVLGAGDPLQLTSVGKDPSAGERAMIIYFIKVFHFMEHPDPFRTGSVEQKGLCLACRRWSSGKFCFLGGAHTPSHLLTDQVSSQEIFRWDISEDKPPILSHLQTTVGKQQLSSQPRTSTISMWALIPGSQSPWRCGETCSGLLIMPAEFLPLKTASSYFRCSVSQLLNKSKHWAA